MTFEIQRDVLLAPLTTFEIGGPAQYYAEVRTEEEIREAIEWAKNERVRFTILAGGSNVLIPDEGLRGLVIHIVEGSFSFEENRLSADTGCNLMKMIRAASDRGLGGWEKLSGIPGTIGGAVRGNAGAFGPEIKDFLVETSALSATSGETKTFETHVCDFSYRHSFFKDHPEWIITRVVVELPPSNTAESTRLSEETIAEREKRHLQNVKAAGSFFMNPVAPAEIVEMFEREKGVKSKGGRVPAGWLIEKAGMKGATMGGAIASPQHPNYIVNMGNATAKDVLLLADKVKSAVLGKFGVQMQEEAAII